MLRYIRIKKFAEISGYTEKAVYCKIAEGVWIEGLQYRRAPDSNIVVDLVAYEQWVEGKLPAQAPPPAPRKIDLQKLGLVNKPAPDPLLRDKDITA